MRQAIRPLQWTEAFCRRFPSYTDAELTESLRKHHPDSPVRARILCELWARDNGLSIVRVVPQMPRAVQVPTYHVQGEPLRKIR